ncbi:class C sortase [Aedoeadaptatus urinae]|uniref:class C sortase n=1 Tax=Aedoeadaptatus urinae TaxID=1871017 RepID=UPI00097D67DD|nr:class C sortase [Peptoniphilus urinae]
MASSKRKTWPFVVIFILGFLLMMYPMISNYYYRIDANREIQEFQDGANKLDDVEILRRIELARAYNQTLDPSKLGDPYTEKEKEGIAAYAKMLEVAEKIGFVEIPKIDVNLPIYAGTSMEVLDKGCGHLEGTSLPVGGPSTHAVLTAHRGLPKAKMFRDLDKLKEGDVFYVHNIQTVLAYKVDRIMTVEPSNFDPILVEEGKDYTTLLTCTPYMINSHRLLVRGHRIPYTPPVDESNRGLPFINMDFRDALLFALPLLILLALIYAYQRKQFKKQRARVDALYGLKKKKEEKDE